MKLCKKCGEKKVVAEFHKNAATKDGLSSHCKPCVRAYQKARFEAKKAVVTTKKRAVARKKKDMVNPPPHYNKQSEDLAKALSYLRFANGDDPRKEAA